MNLPVLQISRVETMRGWNRWKLGLFFFFVPFCEEDLDLTKCHLDV